MYNAAFSLTYMKNDGMVECYSGLSDIDIRQPMSFITSLSSVPIAALLKWGKANNALHSICFSALNFFNGANYKA